MTAQEYAIELVNKYHIKVDVLTRENSIPYLIHDKITYQYAKKFALICIEEILNADKYLITEKQEQYYEEVKQEIEKL